jgi:molecular chaperone DnaK (HSP70)
MTDQTRLKRPDLKAVSDTNHLAFIARKIVITGLALILVACGKSAVSSRVATPTPGIGLKSEARAILELPIGIKTLDSKFTPLIQAGTMLPITHSEVFGNAEDNQKGIEVNLSQQRPDGLEIVASIYADELPPRPKGKLSGVVTLSVNAMKELKVKVTVVDTGFVKEYGPFPVK